MASKKDPTIGLATVYRMVGVLEEMGFFKQRIQIFLSSGR